MHPFRKAAESGDADAVLELMSPDVVFNSPVVFRPYHGREALGAIPRAVMGVLEDFHYEREIGAEGTKDHALMFRARVGDRALQVRPRSAAVALAEATSSELLA